MREDASVPTRGKHAKRLRKQKGYSQAALATLADVNRRTVIRLEQGASSLQSLRLIAPHLGVAVSDLLDENVDILDEGVATSAERPVRVQMTFDIPPEVYRAYALVRGLIRLLIQIARIRGGLTLEDEFFGSVVLLFWLGEEDAVRLREAFVEGRFDSLRAVELRLPKEFGIEGEANADGDQVVFRRDMTAMSTRREDAVALLRQDDPPNRSIWAFAGIAALAASIALVVTLWYRPSGDMDIAMREGFPFVQRDSTKGSTDNVQIGEAFDRKAIADELARDASRSFAVLYAVDDAGVSVVATRNQSDVEIRPDFPKRVRGIEANVLFVLVRTSKQCPPLLTEATRESLSSALEWLQTEDDPTEKRIVASVSRSLRTVCDDDPSVTIWQTRRIR